MPPTICYRVEDPRETREAKSKNTADFIGAGNISIGDDTCAGLTKLNDFIIARAWQLHHTKCLTGHRQV